MYSMSSTNSHTHVETSWKRYYDAKKILRQTEQRLKDASDYYPHVHLDNNDLSNLSSPSFLIHPETSTIHAGNRTMLNDERLINNKHQLLDSEALQTIRRKINKQKVAAERRAEQIFHSQSDAGHMFESYRPHSAYATSASLQNLHYSPHRQQRFSPPKPPPSYSSHLSQSQSFPSELDAVLRHSTSSKILHRDNDLERTSFQQATSRKITKTLPKENYSLTNGRSMQPQRSASATANLSTKYPDLPSTNYLSPSNTQRLKHVRRVESAHIPSNSTNKTNLITPDSWRTEPFITKKPSTIAQEDKTSKKKTAVEIVNKRTKTDLDEPLNHINQRIEKITKSKRDTSASKPSVITSEKTPISKPKSDDEKKKLQDYIQQKRQEHDEILSNEKRLKDKFKKFNDTSQQQQKRTSAFTSVITPKDLTEQTRQRLVRLLGPSVDYSLDQPSAVHQRSPSSSSSSSNDSFAEIQPSKFNDPLLLRSRSEPPFQNGSISTSVQRHENILRWAVNLTRDCDIVENRFKYIRPDGTQPIDTSPAYQHLQHDDGNLRYQMNPNDSIKSRLTNGRLNSHRLTDYQSSTITTTEHRDFVSERHLYHDRAAAKIQAAYRGYTVRKSLPWLNEKQKHLDDDYNQRSTHYRESPSVNIDIRLTTNPTIPIDSTLLRYYENPIVEEYPQQTIRKTTLPLYSDDYDNVPNVPLSNISTPNNQKPIGPINPNLQLDLASGHSSTSTTPIPSPEPHVPSEKERRRSISPPLPPQMSPDNGRPIPHLTQIINQRPVDENIETLERSKSNSRTQNLIVNGSSQQQQTRKSPVRQSSSSTTSSSSSTSSSTATNRKLRSSSPPQQQTTTISTHSRHRTSQNSSPPTSSSESILTAREKRVRQKFNSDIELQAYEKRLKDIEKKIRQLVKRAFEIFNDKPNLSSPPTNITRPTKTNLSTSNRSKSINHSQDESSISDEISIHQKDSEHDASSLSNQQRHSDVLTSDASDIERRVRAYREQLKAKKAEFEKLRQRKNKEILRRQENELKKQIETYDYEIQTLRSQPIQQEQTVPVPIADSNEKTKPITEKSGKQEVDEIESRPVETPHDDRDTQDDAQSIVTDLPVESETEYKSQHITIEDEKPTIDLNLNSTEKEESSSSSSSTSKASERNVKSPSPQASKSPSTPSSELSPPPVQESTKSPLIEQEQKPSTNDYDEDFSEHSHSQKNLSKENNNDIESIQEDIEDKPSIQDPNQSTTSKSSTDEQSEILVLVKKSPNVTPRQQEEEQQEQLPSPSTSSQSIEKESQINTVTDNLIHTLINEAIDHGKQIETIKIKNSVTKEASEWMSDDDSTDEENSKPIPITHEDDAENPIETLAVQKDFLEQIETPNGSNEHEELKLDLSPLDDKNSEESRTDSPRKPVIEELIKPVVAHTPEQVIKLCREALTILYNQNTDFSDRLTINRTIPDSYFTLNQEEEVSENPEIERNRRAYCRMIFDLCIELLHEMYSPNIRTPKYPEWQKSRLISKRFYRFNKPKTRAEVENFIEQKILEILNLNPRQIIYTKWRQPISRQYDSERFETVLDEELRRTETQWTDYEEDTIRIKFDIAEKIFEQILHETINDCVQIVNKRLVLSSNSTRL